MKKDKIERNKNRHIRKNKVREKLYCFLLKKNDLVMVGQPIKKYDSGSEGRMKYKLWILTFFYDEIFLIFDF